MRRRIFPASFRHMVVFGWGPSVVSIVLATVLATASCGGSRGGVTPIQTADAGGDDTGIDQPSDGNGQGDGDDAPNQPGLQLGAACAATDVCASGFCVDGACCESACAQACYSCNLAGSSGNCVPAEVGSDPRDECPDDGPPSCGRDGQCDGSGSCRRYPIGVTCRPTTCNGTTRTNAFRCDSAGACRPTSGQPCDPYVCAGDGTDCQTTCTSNADCVAGRFCSNGSCGRKPLGGGCAGDDDCNSGMCQQGVCCGCPCSGTCRSCAVPGAAGTCTDVPAGQDPLDQCADGGRTSCGGNGVCDGRGACQLYSAGTVCKDPTCDGARGTPQGRCDGLGTCAVGPTVTCGTCQVCTLTATAALCSQVPAGLPPPGAEQCVNQGAASCGTDGTCDGAGACRLYASGTVCVAGRCPVGSTRLSPRLCNGAGLCQAATAAVCPGGFLCDATNNVCKIACTTTTSVADCATPNVCTGTICGTLKLQYNTGAVAAATTSPHPQFLIVNLGAVNVPLSDIAIRYWYTADGAQGQSATIDYAISNSNGVNVTIQPNVTSLFTPVTRSGADTIFQVGFTAAAGNLAPDGGLALIQSRFNSANFATTYTQAGDYSFDATKAAFADWTHVTVYQRGVLVWGIEPPAP